MDRNAEIWRLFQQPFITGSEDALRKSEQHGSRLTRTLDETMRMMQRDFRDKILNDDMLARRREVQKIRTAIIMKTRMKIATKEVSTKRTATSVSQPVDKFPTIPRVRMSMLVLVSAFTVAVGGVLVVMHDMQT